MILAISVTLNTSVVVEVQKLLDELTDTLHHKPILKRHTTCASKYP